MTQVTRPASFSLTAEELTMLEVIESMYVKIGKPKSKSQILRDMIHIAFPKIKKDLEEQLYQQNQPYMKPMDRLLLAIWRQEMEESK